MKEHLSEGDFDLGNKVGFSLLVIDVRPIQVYYAEEGRKHGKKKSLENDVKNMILILCSYNQRQNRMTEYLVSSGTIKKHAESYVFVPNV